MEKALILGKIEGPEKKAVTEDEMVGWHHRLNGHEFKQAPGDGEGQGRLAGCSLWGRRESDTVKQLNNRASKLSQWLCIIALGIPFP